MPDSPNHDPDDLLETWKEIATYLRRDVRTVQRMEQDGLPIYRHPTKKRSYVYAYRSEIDAWREHTPAPRNRFPQRLTRAFGILGVAAIAAAATWFASSPRDTVAATMDPAISPDGAAIAFAWPGARGDNADIYTRPSGVGGTRRLTTHPADDLHPVWSPDSSRIAFLRTEASGSLTIHVVPANGGPERKVAELVAPANLPDLDDFQLCWTPDSNWLLFPHRPSPASDAGIFMASIESGQQVRVTNAQAGWDLDPVLVPAANALLFTRIAPGGVSELFQLPLDSGFLPSGSPSPLTPESR